MGGPTDALARSIAEQVAREIGQPIVIDNAPGAGGTVGTTKAARANAELLRLKEAVAAGLTKVGTELGADVQARALQIFNGEVRRHLAGSEAELNGVMEEAERLGG